MQNRKPFSNYNIRWCEPPCCFNSLTIVFRLKWAVTLHNTVSSVHFQRLRRLSQVISRHSLLIGRKHLQSACGPVKTLAKRWPKVKEGVRGTWHKMYQRQYRSPPPGHTIHLVLALNWEDWIRLTFLRRLVESSCQSLSAFLPESQRGSVGAREYRRRPAVTATQRRPGGGKGESRPQLGCSTGVW